MKPGFLFLIMDWFNNTTPEEKAIQIQVYFQDAFPDDFDRKVASLLCADLIMVHSPKFLIPYWESVIKILRAS